MTQLTVKQARDLKDARDILNNHLCEMELYDSELDDALTVMNRLYDETVPPSCRHCVCCVKPIDSFWWCSELPIAWHNIENPDERLKPVEGFPESGCPYDKE